MVGLVVRLAAVAASSLMALVVAGVLIGSFLIMGPVSEAAEVLERQSRFATAIQSAALHAKGIANDERGFLLSGDAEFLVEIDQRTALARSAIAHAFENADGAELGAVELARAGFERWLSAVRADVATFRAGDREAALDASLGTTRALRKVYERSLGDAQALGEGGLLRAESSLSAASSRSVAILFGYLAIAIAIGVAVIGWLVHAVLRPAYGRVWPPGSVAPISGGGQP